MRQIDLVIRLASDMRSREVVGAFMDMLDAEFTDYDDFVKKYGMLYSKNQVPLSLLMIDRSVRCEHLRARHMQESGIV
jgi:hypothetical protein